MLGPRAGLWPFRHSGQSASSVQQDGDQAPSEVPAVTQSSAGHLGATPTQQDFTPEDQLHGPRE